MDAGKIWASFSAYATGLLIKTWHFLFYFLSSSFFGVIAGVFIGSYLTKRSELKKIKIEKMEKILNVLHDLINSLSCFQKRSPLLQSKNNLRIEDVPEKLKHLKILMILYVGDIKTFTDACEMIQGKHGVIALKKSAFSLIGPEPKEKEENYRKKLEETIEKLTTVENLIMEKIQSTFKWWKFF